MLSDYLSYSFYIKFVESGTTNFWPPFSLALVIMFVYNNIEMESAETLDGVLTGVKVHACFVCVHAYICVYIIMLVCACMYVCDCVLSPIINFLLSSKRFIHNQPPKQEEELVLRMSGW